MRKKPTPKHTPNPMRRFRHDNDGQTLHIASSISCSVLFSSGSPPRSFRELDLKLSKACGEKNRDNRLEGWWEKSRRVVVEV